MRIVACVIWYDEAPDDLLAMARSVIGFADGMVAIDGAFTDFPTGVNKMPWSSHDQASAIFEGCAGQMDLMVYQPLEQGRWFGHDGNEVEKRNASVRLAGDVMGADWIFNIDADMLLQSYGDARERMARTTCDVVLDDIEGNAARHVFRYSPGLHYFRSHWIMLNEKGMLSGPADSTRGYGDYPKLRRPLDLTDTLLFGHPERADYWRRVRQSGWYDIRDGVRELERW